MLKRLLLFNQEGTMPSLSNADSNHLNQRAMHDRKRIIWHKLMRRLKQQRFSSVSFRESEEMEDIGLSTIESC